MSFHLAWIHGLMSLCPVHTTKVLKSVSLPAAIPLTCIRMRETTWYEIFNPGQQPFCDSGGLKGSK